MLFYAFDSQEQRRAFSGSAFIEMQYCRLPVGTGVKELVAVDNIVFWLDDSLYIHDDIRFYNRYSSIFDCGVYNNLQSGPVDTLGINYYSSQAVENVIRKLKEIEPPDYNVLLAWLEKAQEFNGIYILGL